MTWLPLRIAVGRYLVTLYWVCQRCGKRMLPTRTRHLPRVFWMDRHDARFHGRFS